MKWRFKYEKDGQEIEASASIGASRLPNGGIDWETPVQCSDCPDIKPIVGVSEKESEELAVEFLEIFYERFDLRKIDGGPFDWRKDAEND